MTLLYEINYLLTANSQQKLSGAYTYNFLLSNKQQAAIKGCPPMKGTSLSV